MYRKKSLLGASLSHTLIICEEEVSWYIAVSVTRYKCIEDSKMLMDSSVWLFLSVCWYNMNSPHLTKQMNLKEHESWYISLLLEWISQTKHRDWSCVHALYVLIRVEFDRDEPLPQENWWLRTNTIKYRWHRAVLVKAAVLMRFDWLDFISPFVYYMYNVPP